VNVFVLDISIEHRSDALRKDFSTAFIVLFSFFDYSSL